MTLQIQLGNFAIFKEIFLNLAKGQMQAMFHEPLWLLIPKLVGVWANISGSRTVIKLWIHRWEKQAFYKTSTSHPWICLVSWIRKIQQYFNATKENLKTVKCVEATNSRNGTTKMPCTSSIWARKLEANCWSSPVKNAADGVTVPFILRKKKEGREPKSSCNY